METTLEGVVTTFVGVVTITGADCCTGDDFTGLGGKAVGCGDWTTGSGALAAGSGVSCDGLGGDCINGNAAAGADCAGGEDTAGLAGTATGDA